MSGRLHLDSVEFARKGDVLRGEVALRDCERLQSALSEIGGSVQFTLRGRVGAERKPSLTLLLRGRLPLTCQRCLQAFEFKVETDREFVLMGRTDEEVDLVAEDPGTEHIPADAQLDVMEFVESELLLELPMVPLHPEGQCSLPAWMSEGEGETKGGAFGVLGAVKRNHRKE